MVLVKGIKKMICIIATINLKDGKRENYLEEMRKILPIVQKEEGCIQYQPTVDVDTDLRFQIKYRPDTVTVLEKWDSLEALKEHAMATHMTDFRHAVKEFIQFMQLQILTPVQ
jgi:quinol monooxygenase YgiN